MKNIFIFSILLFFSHVTFAQQKEENSGLIYGKDFSYILKAPKGWVLDNSSAAEQGIYAVFYPIGGSWNKSIAVMYTNTSIVDSLMTMEDFIDMDLVSFKADKKDIVITSKDDIYMGDKNVKIREILGDANGNYEAIAYIKEKNLVVLIVLSSRNKNEYFSNLPKFEELLKSYKFIDSKVEIDIDKK